jgi:hypothetical protein
MNSLEIANNVERSKEKLMEVLGNIDALETEVVMLQSEILTLQTRIEELEDILRQKTQAC